MAASLSTIGSIAGHVSRSFVLPAGISGNLVETVDLQLQEVVNYTGQDIGSNSIDNKYQSVIVNFSKAQALDEAFAWAATVASSGTSNVGAGISSNDISLAELSVSSSDKSAEAGALEAISSMSKDTPKMFRQMAMNGLKNLGRAISLSKSLS